MIDTIFLHGAYTSLAAGGAGESDVIDIANLTIQISIAVVGLVALTLAITGFWGLTQTARIRRDQKDTRRELALAKAARSEIQERLDALQSDLATIVSVAYRYNEGQAAYLEGDYRKAEASFRAALNMQSDNAQVQIRLARALINVNEIPEAVAILRKLVSKYPRNANAFRALATCFRYIDRNEALRYIDTALSLDDSSIDNWNYKGILLTDEGQFDEALKAHQQALLRSPEDPQSNFLCALLCLKLGRRKEASRALRNAYEQAEANNLNDRSRPIWADTIKWTYLKSLGTSREDEALEQAQKLRVECTESRNTLTVLKHMITFLRADGKDPQSDPAIMLFSHDKVEEALASVP